MCALPGCTPGQTALGCKAMALQGHTSSSASGVGGLISSECSTAAHYSLERLHLVSKGQGSAQDLG